MGSIRVGVGVIIFNDDGQVLMGKRISSNGNGEFSFPGGKVDLGETFEETAVRETKEETNLVILEPEILGFSNNVLLDKYEGDQWITVYVKAMNWKGQLQVVEREKCESWNWYNLDEIPQPLFEATRLGLELLHKGCFFTSSKKS